MMVAIFILIFPFSCYVSGENSKSRDFQNDLAARMTAFAQFMSTPGFRQGKDSFNHRLHLAVVD